MLTRLLTHTLDNRLNTYKAHRGPESRITRQLILGPGEDEDIFQLSLTFKFQPTVALLQLGAGNRWRRSLEEVEEFRSFIVSLRRIGLKSCLMRQVCSPKVHF